MYRDWKNFELHSRNTDIKGDFGEVSDRNEHVIENWRKGMIMVIK